jgi:hypothetical protein
MKDFLLEGLLYPFLAILFCLAFGVPFTYAGFQTIHVEGFRENGVITMDIERKHFWGLYTVERHVENAINADLTTARFRQGGRWRRATGVFLITEGEPVRVMAGSSDADYKLKWEMINSINDFIKSENELIYNRTFHIHNIFGWFGLPFLVLGILGLIGWPGSIIKRLRD